MKGCENVVADTLSRYPPQLGDASLLTERSPIVVPICKEYFVAFFESSGMGRLRDLFHDLYDNQKKDDYFGPIINILIHGGSNFNESIYRPYHIQNGILVYKSERDHQARLAVPSNIVDVLVKCYHEQYGHFGISKIYSILKRNFYFPRMRRKVHHLIRACDVCQKSKYPPRHLLGTMNPIIVHNPGELVTVDFYGPLPEGRAKATFIFVVIDAFSKYVRLYPLRRAQSKIAALKIINDFSKIIPVQTVLSDHGSQFTSRIWQDLLKSKNIRPTFSSIRHPGSNPTERVMKELGRLFRTYCSQSHAGWPNQLSKIEVLFNNTPHLSTGYAPSEVLYGRTSRTTLDDMISPYLPRPADKNIEAIRAEVRIRLRECAQQRSKHFTTRHDELEINDLVLLRENPISDASNKILYKFCPLYSGPYKVIAKPYPNVYTLADPLTNNRKGNFNITNLKYYYRS